MISKRRGASIFTMVAPLYVLYKRVLTLYKRVLTTHIFDSLILFLIIFYYFDVALLRQAKLTYAPECVEFLM